MRLSEAIRLGAMMHPQCFHTQRLYDLDRTVATCALGAAVEAGFNFIVTYDDTTPGRQPVRCPTSICPCWFWSVARAIVHLNDDHQWTREAIADWVEQHIESRESSSSSVVPKPTREESSLVGAGSAGSR